MIDSKNNMPSKTTWTEKKARIIALYPQITEGDFMYEMGKKDVMFNALANKIGIKRDDLENLLAGF